ncbi:MAG: hypothetical protein ABIY52_11765 [Gemmatimonadaceae bacterium]
MLGVLLAGALASSVVAGLAVTHIVLGVVIACSVVVGMLPVRQRGGSVVAGAALRVLWIALAAVVIARVLEQSANTFYTAASLLDGMLALLVLHLLSRVMRWVAVEMRDSAATLPAVALADALASVSAWMLLAFWVLVVLERRHVASVALVFTGTLLVLECAMLIPDALAACGLLPRGLDARRR